MTPGKNPLEAAEQCFDTVNETVKDALQEAGTSGKRR